MSWKIFVTILALAMVGLAYWFGGEYLQNRDLITYLADGTSKAVTGWGILLSLWPASVISGMIGGSLITLLLIFLYRKAAVADQQESIETYRKMANKAENERDEALEGEKFAEANALKMFNDELLRITKFTQASAARERQAQSENQQYKEQLRCLALQHQEEIKRLNKDFAAESIQKGKQYHAFKRRSEKADTEKHKHQEEVEALQSELKALKVNFLKLEAKSRRPANAS